MVYAQTNQEGTASVPLVQLHTIRDSSKLALIISYGDKSTQMPSQTNLKYFQTGIACNCNESVINK